MVYAIVFVAACGSSSSAPAEPDCKAVLGDPSALMNTDEKDAAKLWARFEACAAPNGDTCDRAAASSGSIGGASDVTYATRCRALPPADQQCLLTSYGSTHVECGKVQEAFRRAHPGK